MGLLTGLFRTMRKKLSLTQDTDMGAFRDKITALVEQKDSLDDGAVAEKVAELVSMTEDLPDGEDKEKLKRYLEDFKAVKSQEGEVATEAAKAVADLFEKLDKEAMEGDLGIPAKEEVKEEITEEVPAPAPEGEDVAAEEEVKEDGTEDMSQETEIVKPTPEGGIKKEKSTISTDADPDPEYSMEEIYQFIKKRMAEDAEAPAEEEKVEETEEDAEEIEDACGTKDHGMPGITLGGTSAPAAKGGLNELYKKMKGE